MEEVVKKKRGRPKKQPVESQPIEEVVTEDVTEKEPEYVSYSKSHPDEIVCGDKETGDIMYSFKMKKSLDEPYEILGKPKLISAMSRQSISYRGNYYTFEYKEERELPTDTFVDLNKEKDALWTSVNSEVDKQINDMIDFLNGQES